MTNTKTVEILEGLNLTEMKEDARDWLVDNLEAYEGDLEGIVGDLQYGGCESGLVGHLIYYKHTVEFFDKYEDEILQILSDNYGITEPETYEGAEELENYFPRLESAEDKLEMWDEESREQAEEEAQDDYSEEWDEMDEDEQESIIFDYMASNPGNPFELSDHDKNYLAWMGFEYAVSVVYEMYLEEAEEE